MQFYSPDTIYVHTRIATMKTKRRLKRAQTRRPYGVVTDEPPIFAFPKRTLKENFCPAMQVVHAQYRLQNLYQRWRNAECLSFIGSLNKSKEPCCPEYTCPFRSEKIEHEKMLVAQSKIIIPHSKTINLHN